MNERLIKILIVDDSFFMRNVLTRILSEIPGFSVIGTASDGVDFLRKMETLDPDVITLDIEMPKMDGLTALGQLMPKKPKPVVILSSLAEEGAEATIRALQLGAVDFLLKPSGAVSLDIGKVKEELANKIRMAAGIKIRPVTETRVSRPAVESAIGDKDGRHLKDSDRVVLIGSSTGGPKALMELVPHLSRDMDAAFLLVQHMPSGFTQSLAARINQASSLEVREARHGDEIQGGVALLAPGDQHMVVAEEKGRKVVHLNNEPRVWGVRPSVDITINSAVPFKKKFVDYLTINVSELFRDAPLFAELKHLVLPQLLKRSPRLSVWSAGCSIGAEAYTMAIMLNELTPDARHRIFGTDLDEEIVKRAHQGVYSRDEVRQVAPEILGKYFTLNDGKYYVQDEIKRRVTFSRHNLLTDRFESGLDLILCRNVVIYFTNEAKEMLYKKFYDALKPGGVLFVGGTETILNYQSIGFKLTRTFFYEKPL